MADSPDRWARRGFSYYAFKGWPLAELSLSVPSALAEEISRSEAEIVRLNNDPPRTRLLEAVRLQLLRAEAIASSRIEGYDLSHRRLAEAVFDPSRAAGKARTVYGNVAAMETAVARASEGRSLRVADIRAMHATLFAGTRDEGMGGFIRDSQNWIGGSDHSPYGAEYVPVPEGEVSKLLEDLCDFVDRDDMPAVLQAALAHAQFETVHPFVDGNGRVGRCLIHVVLRRRGLAPHYVPPISVALAAAEGRYVEGLTAYRAGRSDQWVGVFVAAANAAARRAEQLGREIETLQEEWRERAGRPRRGSAADALIGLLALHPVIDVRSAADLAGVTDEAARLAIDRLGAAGVLQEVTGRLRGRSWECVGLFALLDEFERTVVPPRGAQRRGPRRTQRELA